MKKILLGVPNEAVLLRITKVHLNIFQTGIRVIRRTRRMTWQRLYPEIYATQKNKNTTIRIGIKQPTNIYYLCVYTMQYNRFMTVKRNLIYCRLLCSRCQAIYFVNSYLSFENNFASSKLYVLEIVLVESPWKALFRELYFTTIGIQFTENKYHFE